MSPSACKCGSTSFEETGHGLDFCLQCGLGRRGTLKPECAYWSQDNIIPKQVYTRQKRFKKYFFRVMRRQSANTIPQETWEYLLARGPYRCSKHIQRTLKAARHLKRKCYDSLPFLTDALCPHIKVPVLTENERKIAFDLFDKIDKAIVKGPFVSYLYCLEYILMKMGRSDVCRHINTIQCPRRRTSYKKRLDVIFKYHKSDEIPVVRDLSQFGFCSRSVGEP